MDNSDSFLVYCTFPNRESARDCSKSLLERKLVACANIFDSGESFYIWDGKVECDSETFVLFKTLASNYEEIEKQINSSHPYDTPCIWGSSIEKISPEYKKWLTSSLS